MTEIKAINVTNDNNVNNDNNVTNDNNDIKSVTPLQCYSSKTIEHILKRNPTFPLCSFLFALSSPPYLLCNDDTE
jgi:hypothetical protein